VASGPDSAVTNSLVGLGGDGLLTARSVDVGASRESRRRRRLWTVAGVLGVPTAFLWYRFLVGRPFDVFALPHSTSSPFRRSTGCLSPQSCSSSCSGSP